MVKGKKNSRHAVSDWMEIEKQRGISVTSSVLQFRYEGKCINILDTPGHQDFSEDTYRTLMAADSAVMVIDASKGVEAQTRKLFKVCAMRGVPPMRLPWRPGGVHLPHGAGHHRRQEVRPRPWRAAIRWE